MNIIFRVAALPALLVLAACGGGGGGGSAGLDLNIGTTDPNNSANGLAFAAGGEVIADAEGQPITVRLAQFETDYATGQTRLLVSTETVTYPAGDLASFGGDNPTITYRGETLVFVGGSAILANGQEALLYTALTGTYSEVRDIYVYAAGPPPTDGSAGFDSEGFFVIGFETDPDTIAARTDVSASYDGRYESYGQVLDLAGDVVSTEVLNAGAISLSVDFSAGTVSGSMGGSIAGLTSYTATIAETDIIGNGFASTMSIDCAAGATCSSNSLIGGAFYGPTGEELSGVMVIDETIDDPIAGVGFQYIGAGGFVTNEILP
ncbi:MAG: transferrin-binding protein-like solute binding protein [Alphaproteobacteria bacterium]|nr:transferrin-binding protein-like solute binding protein [Alphaproteobacteria bacterium]